jgi:thiol-disulfide isomerase/thioredoxin
MPFSLLIPRWTYAAALIGLIAGCSAPSEDASESEAGPSTTPEVVESRIRQLVSLADSLAEKNRLPEAMSYLADAVKIDPESRLALQRSAQYSLVGGRMTEAKDREMADVLSTRALHFAERMEKAHPDLTPDEKNILALSRYAQARILARREKPEEAIASLKSAIEAGFDDYDALATDPDVESLRSREDFQALLKPIEEKARADSVEQARKLLAESKSFPFDFELPNLEGKAVKLADLRGKVTIVDIWGTWCGPCRIEIPHLKDLYERYHDQGLEIIGVNYEQTDEPEQAVELIKSFIEAEKLPYPCVVGDEETMKLLEPFEGFPTTLFLDATGKVRAKLVGAQPKRSLEALVNALLAESTVTAGGE